MFWQSDKDMHCVSSIRSINKRRWNKSWDALLFSLYSFNVVLYNIILVNVLHNVFELSLKATWLKVFSSAHIQEKIWRSYYKKRFFWQHLSDSFCISVPSVTSCISAQKSCHEDRNYKSESCSIHEGYSTQIFDIRKTNFFILNQRC